MSSIFEYVRRADKQFSTETIIAECIENGHDALLLDGTTLPDVFFDLSTGVTGTLVHRLSMYGIRMAVVVPDVSVYSKSFQDFVREANNGKQFHFSATKKEAVDWLSGKNS